MSEGLGFSAEALKGVGLGVEKLFVLYPPLYPFLYGVWFFIFGFSITSSLSLSLLICGLIAYFLLQLFRNAYGDPLPHNVYALVFFAWTLAVSAIDRPDPLYVMFALMILLVIETRLRQKSDLPTHLLIAVLLGLSISTSPVIAILMLPVIFTLYINVRGCSKKSFLSFIVIVLGGLLLGLVIWMFVIAKAPPLIKYQFLVTWSSQSSRPLTIESFMEGMRFVIKHGYFLFYLPLILFLIIMSTVSLRTHPNIRSGLSRAWPFISLVAIWIFLIVKVQAKYTYLNMCAIFILLVTGVQFVKVVSLIRNSNVVRLLNATLMLGLFVATVPFWRTVLIPMTWDKYDSYEFNGKRILDLIPKGSKVLTHVRFWYLFDTSYKTFDAWFSHGSIYEADYILLPSGGGGKPDVAWIPFLDSKELKYFKENYVLTASTFIGLANNLFGLNIANSRWSYRFQLYERKK